MGRELIFKDLDGKEYTLKLSGKKSLDVLRDLIENHQLTKEFSYKVITTSNDEILVSNVLGSYVWELSDAILLKILNRFPMSKSIQTNIISHINYSGGRNLSILYKLQLEGLSADIRQEAIKSRLSILYFK